MVGAPTADQVSETLDNDAAEHIREPGDGFAVAVAVLEGLGEVLGDKKREIRVLRLLFRVFVAVSVDGDDSVGVFIDDGASRKTSYATRVAPQQSPILHMSKRRFMIPVF